MRHSGPVVLGRFTVGWCVNCNLPLLAEFCDRCGGVRQEVQITPPGDVRPAFEGDLALLLEAVDRQFGDGVGEKIFPKDKLILLNSTPALDRADEVIMDGHVLGLLKHDPKKLSFEFSPKCEGARRIFEANGRKWVRIDEGAVEPVLNGSNVLAPGVLSADPKIVAGDEVYVLSPSDHVLAVGRSRMGANSMTGGRRGMAIKIRQVEPPRKPSVLKGGQTWSDAVEANRTFLVKHEKMAKQFIRSVVEKMPRELAVAYSGGKDSLATLLLVKDAVKDLKVFFIDTGLEFPETVENVRRVARAFGINLIVEEAGDAFWQAFKFFGPPGRDYRWCCKTCKLGPTAKLMRENFPDGCIVFLGQRKYESDRRYRQPRIWENPWVPGQIGVSPIKDWNALHVWLYIFSKGAEFNPLYKSGFSRIGCWMCPASEIWEFKLVAQKHPGLWQRWESLLKEYAQESGYSEEWLNHAFWRWQALPQGQLKLAQDLGLKLEPKPRAPSGKIKYRILPGFSPCKDGQVSVEGSFDRTLDFGKVANLLTTLGEVRRAEKLGVIKVKIYGAEASVFRTGKFSVIARDEKRAMEGASLLIKGIIRADGCVGCGICASRCPQGAISIFEGRAVINQACTRCLQCYEYCPVLYFE